MSTKSQNLFINLNNTGGKQPTDNQEITAVIDNKEVTVTEVKPKAVEPVVEPVKEPQPEQEDKMAKIKAKMAKEKEEKPKTKQVCFHVTEENIKKLKKHYKDKGQKSELINSLLNAYFAE